VFITARGKAVEGQRGGGAEEQRDGQGLGEVSNFLKMTNDK